MSTDVQWEGGFSGKKRHGTIHNRLFSILSEYGDGRDDEDVFNWLADEIGWENLSVNEECIFASLAKALPYDNFHYETSFDYEGGGLSQMCHDIDYANGKLNLSTTSLGETNGDNLAEKENVYWDDEYSIYVKKDEMSLWCTIDNNGIIGNEELSQGCLELEKERTSNLLKLIETGTEDPDELVDLGILFETGLAGLEKNLKKAWYYYLKAAETGDDDAIEFVREIFSDENREDLEKLLSNKCISKDSFPIFYDLASKENNAGVTAQLREYKNSLA